MLEKLCPPCNMLLPISQFWKDSNASTGYRSWCKNCCAKSQGQRVLTWKSKNPERVKQLSRDFRDKQRSKELCESCSNKILPNRNICEKHYVVSVAKACLGKADSKTVDVLLKRFHENPVCPYTEKVLVLGVNAHLDHIKSRKNHPELVSSIDNVEWIHETANLCKSSFDKDDFIAFCKFVANKYS